MTMADILECIGILVWIALAAYSFHHVRRLTRRIDDALDKLDASFEQKEGNGPW